MINSDLFSFDFTLKKYRQFCEALKNLSCPILTVKDFVSRNQPGEFLIIMRHDVDRRLSAAIRMAKLEAEFDISASYYVRMTQNVFKPEAIKSVLHLGHEVGYHYEVLSKAKGNLTQSINIFETELKKLREVVPISTISMHGSPLSQWNNLDLWNVCDFKDYNVMAETSLSINYTNIYYFTDTGRNWNANRFNLRDRVDSKKPLASVETTDQLIDFINRKYPSPVLINVHPNRWAATAVDFMSSNVLDWTANRVKWLFSLSRS
jgi:hypothetical protein